MQLRNLTADDNQPVIESSKDEYKFFFCGNFTGELSSVTGINSRFLYIARIDPINGIVSNPTVTITCSPECKDYCINLKKRK